VFRAHRLALKGHCPFTSAVCHSLSNAKAKMRLSIRPRREYRMPQRSRSPAGSPIDLATSLLRMPRQPLRRPPPKDSRMPHRSRLPRGVPADVGKRISPSKSPSRDSSSSLPACTDACCSATRICISWNTPQSRRVADLSFDSLRSRSSSRSRESSSCRARLSLRSAREIDSSAALKAWRERDDEG